MLFLKALCVLTCKKFKANSQCMEKEGLPKFRRGSLGPLFCVSAGGVWSDDALGGSCELLRSLRRLESSCCQACSRQMLLSSGVVVAVAAYFANVKILLPHGATCDGFV
mmetsp:Transcript_25371/g.48566  ORF Transcript_25371/g.48566 Transcript_25371/m.48566 type:complete len:109 (+) Transcript_25371:182-508(+)